MVDCILFRLAHKRHSGFHELRKIIRRNFVDTGYRDVLTKDINFCRRTESTLLNACAIMNCSVSAA